MKTLITGANGFIGKELCAKLLDFSWQVRGAVRTEHRADNLAEGIKLVTVGDLGQKTDWATSLECIKVVVHISARVHVLNDKGIDQLPEYRKANVFGSENLARQAAAAGVKRFVYLSSIKVHGESSRRPYTETDKPFPEDPYAISKLEAEEALWKVSFDTGLEVVIIRPPMVYGPGVKANFLRLLEMVDRGIPLPLGCVKNRRSMIFLGNLVDAIVCCMEHPNAVGQTFLVSDGEDVSTPELIKRVALSLGRPARILPFPLGMLRLAGRLTGKSDAIERLVGTLQVGSSMIQTELGWTPPFTMEQGLRETAEWYKNRHEARGNRR